MFYVMNAEKDRVVKRCDSYHEAELKLESLEHNGKDLKNYYIVPTEDYRFEQVDDMEVLFTHTYKVPFTDEYFVEVQNYIENGNSYYRSRLIKKDYSIITEIGAMPVFRDGCKGVYHKVFHNPHPISEEEFLAMMMNQVACHISIMEEDIEWLESKPL